MSTAAFDSMTADEQIAHVQDLWDRIAARPEDIRVSEAWREELARRSADLEAHPDAVIPWDELRAEIRARLDRNG
ncbi:MAG: addiction module protein [Alphaproteobacteria bacterium]|nr:addiction module protein [Alphaproteobacteria bacterium]